MKKAWRSAIERAGLSDEINRYSFRHGLARWMKRCMVPREQIDQYLGHLPQGVAKTTAIYAPNEPELSVDACAAIESFMAEVRKHVTSAKIDDPYALLSGDEHGRLPNGALSEAKHAQIEALIHAGVSIGQIARRMGCSHMVVRRHKKKILAGEIP